MELFIDEEHCPNLFVFSIVWNVLEKQLWGGRYERAKNQEHLDRLSENTLPQVCRNYPRSAVYTPATKEYSLSPSCEGVLQQLWDLPDGIEFV